MAFDKASKAGHVGIILRRSRDSVWWTGDVGILFSNGWTTFTHKTLRWSLWRSFLLKIRQSAEHRRHAQWPRPPEAVRIPSLQLFKEEPVTGSAEFSWKYHYPWGMAGWAEVSLLCLLILRFSAVSICSQITTRQSNTSFAHLCLELYICLSYLPRAIYWLIFSGR